MLQSFSPGASSSTRAKSPGKSVEDTSSFSPLAPPPSELARSARPVVCSVQIPRLGRPDDGNMKGTWIKCDLRDEPRSRWRMLAVKMFGHCGACCTPLLNDRVRLFPMPSAPINACGLCRMPASVCAFGQRARVRRSLEHQLVVIRHHVNTNMGSMSVRAIA